MFSNSINVWLYYLTKIVFFFLNPLWNDDWDFVAKHFISRTSLRENKNKEIFQLILGQNLLENLTECSRESLMDYWRTLRAAMATLQARGLPPNVDPCSPGWMHSITSSSASTAETYDFTGAITLNDHHQIQINFLHNPIELILAS